jgi:hypothetical protein
MNPARRRRFAVRFVLGLALVLGIPVAGQSPFPQFPSSGNGKVGQHYPDSPVGFGNEATPDQKRLRMLNAERQKSIVSDTEKLLKLARELNDEIAAADSSSMTDAQLRKLAEIAKLAKDVKEKMSFSTGGYPGLTPSLANPPNFGNQ